MDLSLLTQDQGVIIIISSPHTRHTHVRAPALTRTRIRIRSCSCTVGHCADRLKRLSLLLILVFAAAACLPACDNGPETTWRAVTVKSASATDKTNPSPSKPTASLASTPAATYSNQATGAALQAFLGSDNRHFKAHYEAKYAGSTTVEVFDFEVWLKGDKLRIDYYKGGVLDRTLLASGDTADYHMRDTGSVIASIMPAPYYLNLFRQDYASAVVSGSAYTFTINSFYKKSNATQGYYVTDIAYAFDSKGIMTQTCLGNSSGGSRPTALNTVTHTFTLMENDAAVPDSLFQPPF